MNDESRSPAFLPPLKQIVIHTDGGAVPNPGPAGYAAVLRFGEHCKEISGGFARSTNNRMELMAVIAALESLKEACRVTVYSDSKYVINSFESRAIFRWRECGWRMKPNSTKPVPNADLWERLLTVYERHAVQFVWVKGHSGVLDNELCDALALAACRRQNMPVDPGYVEEEPRHLIVKPTAATLVKHEAHLKQDSATQPPPAAHSKAKMVEAGQPCRSCQTPVVRRTPKRSKQQAKGKYWYAWYLYCPGCKTNYHVEAAREVVQRKPATPPAPTDPLPKPSQSLPPLTDVEQVISGKHADLIERMRVVGEMVADLLQD